MSKNYIYTFLILIFNWSVVNAQQNQPLLKPGVYLAQQADAEHPNWGYYILKKDSSFLLVGVSKDSTVEHVSKGQWYINKENILTIHFDVCPIKSLPENEVSYKAMYRKNFDSIRLTFAILDKNKDTIPSALVYLDNQLFVQQIKLKNVSGDKTFKRSLDLPRTQLPQKITIKPLDNMLPFFYETTIQPIEGFNDHVFTLYSSYKGGPTHFQPMKEGECNEMSFKKKYVSTTATGRINFGGFILEYENKDPLEIGAILKRAMLMQPDYREYFSWALASL